jgi:hypothetical protein
MEEVKNAHVLIAKPELEIVLGRHIYGKTDLVGKGHKNIKRVRLNSG